MGVVIAVARCTSNLAATVASNSARCRARAASRRLARCSARAPRRWEDSSGNSPRARRRVSAAGRSGQPTMTRRTTDGRNAHLVSCHGVHVGQLGEDLDGDLLDGQGVLEVLIGQAVDLPRPPRHRAWRARPARTGPGRRRRLGS